MRDKFKVPRRKAKKAAPKKANTALTNVIKRVMHRESETKKAMSFLSTPRAMTISSSTEYYRIVPQIQRIGVSAPITHDATRIGNEIVPTSIKTHITLTLQSDTIARDLYVTLYFVKVRGYDNYNDAIPSGGQPLQLLDRCDGTQQGFLGDIVSMDLPVFANSFTLLKKKIIRLKCDPGAQNGPTATSSGYGVLNTCYRFTYNHKLPAKFKYQQDEGYPNNYAPCLLVGYTYADGTTPQPAPRDVLLTFTNVMYYKDE